VTPLRAGQIWQTRNQQVSCILVRQAEQSGQYWWHSHVSHVREGNTQYRRVMERGTLWVPRGWVGDATCWSRINHLGLVSQGLAHEDLVTLLYCPTWSEAPAGPHNQLGL
jgi:hypothetical protein